MSVTINNIDQEMCAPHNKLQDLLTRLVTYLTLHYGKHSIIVTTSLGCKIKMLVPLTFGTVLFVLGPILYIHIIQYPYTQLLTTSTWFP
jgi:hypothetical protein